MVTLKEAIVVNVLLVLLFVGANYFLWYSMRDATYTTVTWSPIFASYVPRFLGNNGELVAVQTIKTILNYPFLTFFLAMAVNLYLIFRLQRSKEIKPAALP